MISVLICSSNPILLSQVQANIKETIGIIYEILYVDNRKLNRGICSVYNELAAKAQFSYLCFLHEDVLFETNGWGKKIIEIFLSDNSIGLLGIAGCKYKSDYFSGWYSNVKEIDCANYTHKYESHVEQIHISPSNDKQLQEVVCIDGVFMCSTKEAWLANKFNEDFLKGFHFYDIDFSLSIAHQYKVVVTYDINLVYITSGGDYGNKWIDIAIQYHLRMKDILPFPKSIVEHKLADESIVITTLDFLKNYNISFKNKFRWIGLQKLHTAPAYYYSILKFLFYKPLSLKYIHTLFKSK